MRKSWCFLSISWDIRRRKNIPCMTWEARFSPNRVPDLTRCHLLHLLSWWTSQFSLLLKIYWYTAKFITPKMSILKKQEKGPTLIINRPLFVSYSFSVSFSLYETRFFSVDNIGSLKAEKQLKREWNSKVLSALLREMLERHRFSNIFSINKNHN